MINYLNQNYKVIQGVVHKANFTEEERAQRAREWKKQDRLNKADITLAHSTSMPNVRVDRSTSPMVGGIPTCGEYQTNIPVLSENKSKRVRYLKMSKIFKDLKAKVFENPEMDLKCITAFLVKYTERMPKKAEVTLMAEKIKEIETISQISIPLDLSVKESVKFVCNQIVKFDPIEGGSRVCQH